MGVLCIQWCVCLYKVELLFPLDTVSGRQLRVIASKAAGAALLSECFHAMVCRSNLQG